MNGGWTDSPSPHHRFAACAYIAAMYWPKRLRYQVPLLLIMHTGATLWWMLWAIVPMWALLVWLVLGYAVIAWVSWRRGR